jgi:glycosyltransferase involved in cell wall biosynthesis
MKILMTGLLPPGTQSSNGGVVAVIHNLLESFSRLEGIEVCLLSFNKEINEPITKQISPNVRLRFFPFKTKIDVADYLLNRKTINQIIKEEQPDLIHIQEITPQLFRFLHLDLRRITVTQHGIMREELRNANTLPGILKSLFKTLVEREIFPIFRNIIFISSYNRSIFNGTPFLSAQIPNPVSKIFFNRPYQPGDPHKILFVAALSRIKNLELLLSAVSLLRREGLNYSVHIAGGFKNRSYEKFILKQVQQKGLKNYVHFHGWMSSEEILKLHSSCALAVLSSRQETLPVAVAEAMATGRVVVASNVGAVPEMIEDKVTGFLFPPGDCQKLVAHLRYLHENPSVIKKISFNASKKAHDCYHPDLIAAATIAFYEKVINYQSEPVSA